MRTINHILVWLRNDLRWHDNPALHQALTLARADSARVSIIFCLTPKQWLEHNDAMCKLAFRAQLLNTLAGQAQNQGICCDYLLCHDFTSVPQALLKYCQSEKINQLFFNREYPINERHRDQACCDLLSQHGIQSRTFEADLLLDIQRYNQQGLAYRSFAPWLKNWKNALKEQLHTQNLAPLPSLLPTYKQAATRQNTIFNYLLKPLSKPQQALLDLFSNTNTQSFRADIWPASEACALQRLEQYCQHKVIDYEQQRDFPSINATSTLSPYLAAGALSPKQCLAALRYHQPQLNLSDNTWLNELAWREFYRYLSWHWPHISYGHNFKAGVNTHQHTRLSPNELAWQQGRTGIALIDAAMRQLKQSGWMHNRLRMLVANYYCHLIGGNWRHGEAFFMHHLIDGDYAANNGGWQWCASSGCDASPWPRIFNPYQQSKKFDPDGIFIRRLLPDLKQIKPTQFHKEQDLSLLQNSYNSPLVDYKSARQQALEYLKA